MAKRKAGRQGRKDFMGSNKGYKYVFIPCAIVIIVSLVYLTWYLNNQNSTYDNIIYIRSFMSSSGQLNDFQNKLGMHNWETDIKWFKTDKEIRIEFGRISLTWEPDKFYEKENLELLSTIGFTVDVKKDGDGNSVLHLYYRGEEVPRWVK